MASAAAGSGNVMVGIFIPAFSYPAPLSYQAIVNAALDDFGLEAEACEFLKPDNDKIACMLKNSKFTLEYIEQTYKHNQSLSQRLQSAADALIAFQEKVGEDELTIDNLKAQLLQARNEETTWRAKFEAEAAMRGAMQEKLEKLKHVVNSDTILQNFGPEPNKPKIPRLQLPSSNSSQMNGPSSPHPSLNGAPITSLASPISNIHSPISTINGISMNGLSLHNSSTPIPSPHDTAEVPSLSIPPNIAYGQAQAQAHAHASNDAAPPPAPRDRMNVGDLRCLVTSPREFRNSSTRDSQAAPSQAAFESAALLRSLVSPRDPIYISHAPSINGKRSSTEMAATSPRRHVSETSPRKVAESPRSPRSVGMAKAHARRHSATSSAEDGAPLRRSSGGSVEVGTPRSTPSPRASKSSSESLLNYFDGHPDHNHGNYQSYQSILDNPGKRRSPAQLRPSRSELELSLDALSQLHQCRLCNCDMFRTGGNADWICTCGHTNIKHSVSYMKASPSQSPTISPRKMFG